MTNTVEDFNYAVTCKKYSYQFCASFCIVRGSNCLLDACNTRNNRPINFPAALMVIWIVYECIVLFLPIIAASTVFEPRVFSVCLDTISQLMPL